MAWHPAALLQGMSPWYLCRNGVLVKGGHAIHWQTLPIFPIKFKTLININKNIAIIVKMVPRYVPDRKRALSTVCSSAKRMWQKFFLLFRIAMIPPHCSNTSTMSCSVAFSGSPPTNTVLQPGGLSLVAGGGRSVKNRSTKDKSPLLIWGLVTFTFFHSLYNVSVYSSLLTMCDIQKDEACKINHWHFTTLILKWFIVQLSSKTLGINLWIIKTRNVVNHKVNRHICHGLNH